MSLQGASFHGLLFAASAIIALLGIIDDYASLPAKLRLATQLLCAGAALYYLSPFPPLHLAGITLTQPWILNLLFLLYITWAVNLYNFMDGIDGLAAVEAITVCAGMVVIYSSIGQTSLIMPPLLLLCSVLGFLCWNFPPARIFMGDTGSSFLGWVVAILSLQAGKTMPPLFWAWIILFGVFVVDATLTLIVRVRHRQAIFQAHRTHAYQYATRYYQSHKTVTLAVAALNMLWLFPWALLVALGYTSGFTGLCIAYVPLFFLAWYWNAGKPE
ncbi:MAG: glycosyltransferase family 4 protein [Legionellaceae bacterium]|nr:glycosyltransferase family 4 protein [Legionellaceae bacterium]